MSSASIQKRASIAQSDIYSQAALQRLKEKAELAQLFFSNIAKKEGIEIWHIQKFTPVLVSAEKHGSFFENDSYVILHTKKAGNGYIWNIHYWIGETSTPDEYGCAAYVAVQIDDHFEGVPIQHREVQGFESELFRSYFPAGIQILSGGIESGFRKVNVKEEFITRLMHVKGKKFVQVNEVPKDVSSLNSGDVFVLDTYDKIYLWIGSECGAFERQKGGAFATALRQKGHDRQTIVSIDDGKDENDEFWAALGGKGKVKTAAEGGCDLEADAGKTQGTKKILRVSDATGAVKFDVVAEGKITRDVLKTDDVFIVDSGFEIFVWIGKKSTVRERHSALTYAQKYLNESARPKYLPITKLVEGVNLPTFEAAFN